MLGTVKIEEKLFRSSVMAQLSAYVSQKYRGVFWEVEMKNGGRTNNSMAVKVIIFVELQQFVNFVRSQQAENGLTQGAGFLHGVARPRHVLFTAVSGGKGSSTAERNPQDDNRRDILGVSLLVLPYQRSVVELFICPVHIRYPLYVMITLGVRGIVTLE